VEIPRGAATVSGKLHSSAGIRRQSLCETHGKARDAALLSDRAGDEIRKPGYLTPGPSFSTSTKEASAREHAEKESRAISIPLPFSFHPAVISAGQFRLGRSDQRARRRP
jgi:hypothetical protein